MKAQIAALRAIVAATECLDGSKSYIALAEALLEIKRIAQKALEAQPDPGSPESRVAYLDARFAQARDFLVLIQNLSHDRYARELATLGIIGIRCELCRVESLETLKKAKAAGWGIRRNARGSVYFLCPDHAAEARRFDREEIPIMRPQSMGDGPERGAA